ncbi:hypothetical protein CVT24_006064 [Panaeolus cyanescens]|uniref:Uncharacterized protein n=1 Tax=Panaeolus cyanescens TaxID=181874 RepID=A0A409V8Q4_9AGAR|nr:hypothetical protein CVT24_006064 [Panaeolus cyanescens]
MSTGNIKELIGLHPNSLQLIEYISAISSSASLTETVIPEVKSYSDAVYLNYYAIGLSLMFAPKDNYKPKSGLKLSEIDNERLTLDSIYLYNIPKKTREDGKTSTRSAELAFSAYPVSPFPLQITATVKDKDNKILARPPAMDVTKDSSGKDFVLALGEPDRKGGGAGPSSGSIGIWCEWTKDGLMVEFGGDEAKGPQAWERGKDAVWKIITVFSA